MQTQIAAVAVDINLLRADLRVVAERSVATEKQVMGLQSEIDTLRASVAILEAKTHKLEARVKDAEEGKACGIRQHPEQELTRQEELATLQRQVDNGDASEADCLEMRGRIVDLWDRLENYVRRNCRQRLFREGDRSGRMLAWLLRRERPVPIIQLLCGSSGERILGQLRVNAHLREHLRVIYAAPRRAGETQIQTYLNGLRLPRLTTAQAEEL
ncbi:hypothetical protein NDU88_004044 [Pleurodeles waltl]|uniref:Uncharacterized protein n=1 Tax=Pleurodeles waltl TaxID=8319 RepID=A0AAV7V0R7_PLEWA|nr:hypothetical protein NDU88_004044 [Pleurodeles waltl]